MATSRGGYSPVREAATPATFVARVRHGPEVGFVSVRGCGALGVLRQTGATPVTTPGFNSDFLKRDGSPRDEQSGLSSFLASIFGTRRDAMGSCLRRRPIGLSLKEVSPASFAASSGVKPKPDPFPRTRPVGGTECGAMRTHSLSNPEHLRTPCVSG